MPRHLMVRRENNSGVDSPIKSSTLSHYKVFDSGHRIYTSTKSKEDSCGGIARDTRINSSSKTSPKHPASNFNLRFMKHSADDGHAFKTVHNLSPSKVRAKLFPISPLSSKSGRTSGEENLHPSKTKPAFQKAISNKLQLQAEDERMLCSSTNSQPTRNIIPLSHMNDRRISSSSTDVQSSRSEIVHCNSYRFLGLKKNLLQRSGESKQSPRKCVQKNSTLNGENSWSPRQKDVTKPLSNTFPQSESREFSEDEIIRTHSNKGRQLMKQSPCKVSNPMAGILTPRKESCLNTNPPSLSKTLKDISTPQKLSGLIIRHSYTSEIDQIKQDKTEHSVSDSVSSTAQIHSLHSSDETVNNGNNDFPGRMRVNELNPDTVDHLLLNFHGNKENIPPEAWSYHKKKKNQPEIETIKHHSSGHVSATLPGLTFGRSSRTCARSLSLEIIELESPHILGKQSGHHYNDNDIDDANGRERNAATEEDILEKTETGNEQVLFLCNKEAPEMASTMNVPSISAPSAPSNHVSPCAVLPGYTVPKAEDRQSPDQPLPSPVGSTHSDGSSDGISDNTTADSGVVTDLSRSNPDLAHKSQQAHGQDDSQGSVKRKRTASPTSVISKCSRSTPQRQMKPVDASTPLNTVWRPWDSSKVDPPISAQQVPQAAINLPVAPPAFQTFLAATPQVNGPLTAHLSPSLGHVYPGNLPHPGYGFAVPMVTFAPIFAPTYPPRVQHPQSPTDTPLNLSFRNASPYLKDGLVSSQQPSGQPTEYKVASWHCPNIVASIPAHDSGISDSRGRSDLTPAKKKCCRPSSSCSKTASGGQFNEATTQASSSGSQHTPGASAPQVQPIPGVILGVAPRGALAAAKFIKGNKKISKAQKEGNDNEDSQRRKRDNPPPYGDRELIKKEVIFYECPERRMFCGDGMEFKPPTVPDDEGEQNKLRLALLNLFQNSNLPKVPSALEFNVHALCFYPKMQHIFNLHDEGVDLNNLKFGAYGQAFSNLKLEALGDRRLNEQLDQMSYVAEDGLLHCLVLRTIDNGAMCGHIAAELGKMRRHARNHYPDRKWVCCFCRCQMSDMTDMERHTSTHTGMKPFRCEQCGKMFSQKVTLSNHVKNQHGSELEKHDPRTTFTCRQDGCIFYENQREECIHHLRMHHYNGDYQSRRRKNQWPFNENPGKKSKSSDQ